MDYRKRVEFGRNWHPARYRVLPYFEHEKKHITPGKRVLDLGCANGWNMSRFGQYGVDAIGLEPNGVTVRHALEHGSVTQADGLILPFADGAFDVIYVQHVLHHIGDIAAALREIGRCLRPGGCLFLVETVEDNPIIRWGRRLYPSWMGDEVNAPFYFAELRRDLARFGFDVTHAEQYSIAFWLWETVRDQAVWLEAITPLFVKLEEKLQTIFNRQSAHCFYVAHRRRDMDRHVPTAVLGRV